MVVILGLIVIALFLYGGVSLIVCGFRDGIFGDGLFEAFCGVIALIVGFGGFVAILMFGAG